MEIIVRHVKLENASAILASNDEKYKLSIRWTEIKQKYKNKSL